MPWINPQGLGFRVTLVSCIPMYILLPPLIQVPNPVPFQSHPRGPAFAFSLSAFASFRDGRKTHLHTHLTRRLSCQRKKRGALKSSSSMHAHAVAVNANLQASAMSQGSSFVKAHAPPAFHSSTAIVGRIVCTARMAATSLCSRCQNDRRVYPPERARSTRRTPWSEST